MSLLGTGLPPGTYATVRSSMFMESWQRTVFPLCTAAIACGVHVRIGIEDTIWAP